MLYQYTKEYDKNGNVVNQAQTIGSKTYTYAYTYNADQQATKVTYGGTAESITYDGFGRVTSSTVSNNGTNRLTTGYTYKTVTEDSKVYETSQVGVLNNNYGGANHNLTYTYDANGNILTVSDGTNITTYTYDSLNQLLSEKNQAAGKSWVYTYDTGGNITSKTEYANATASGTGTTTAYGYTDANWGDLLKTYGSKALTYDNSGNLKTFNGWTYTWQGGRQLRSMTNGSTTLSFAYNDAGLRTSKNDHRYYYQDDLLTADVTSTDALYFHYDANGSILGFTYVSGSTTAEYYYVKNLQGDVIGILDASGNQVASYIYNAWGQVLSVGGSNATLANRNSIRYRSYYYDSETKLYYLQSRYYNPEIGRFISADAYTQTYETAVGANMFAYCGNNPVIGYDPTGHSPKSQIKDFVANYLDPCVTQIKQLWSEAIPGTLTLGKSVSASIGLYAGASKGIAVDRDGNICDVYSITGGTGTPVVGASAFISISNAASVDALGGWSEQVGGAFPIGGYEKVFMLNNNAPNGYYHGNTFSIGPESLIAPAELHVSQSYTFIKNKTNVFAPYDKFSATVKNW